MRSGILPWFLIFLSLMAKDVEHLFRCLFSCCWILRVLYALWIHVHCQLCDLQILSASIRGLSFHLLMAGLPSQTRRNGHMDSFCGSAHKWTACDVAKPFNLCFCFLFYRTRGGMRIFLRLMQPEVSAIPRDWPKFTQLISSRVWLAPRLSPTLLPLFAVEFFFLF